MYKISNTLLKHLVKLRKNFHYREEHHAVVVSGRKLVKELAQKISPKKVFITKSFDAFPVQGEIYYVTIKDLKKITGLLSPEEIVAEFPLPEATSLEGKKRILALDQIADPGNLGTLIRTAHALGWEGVFFLPNCVDPFNDKVLRASRGALFSLPWYIGDWEEISGCIKKSALTPYIADIRGKPLSSFTMKQERVLLLLSNEAHGVSERGKTLGERVSIPMEGVAESLNVAIAGAI